MPTLMLFGGGYKSQNSENTISIGNSTVSRGIWDEYRE